MQLLVPAILLAAVSLAGDESTRTYSASGFHAVDNAGPFEVTIRRGASFAVEATGEARDLDRIRADVKDGALRLSFAKREGKERRERRMPRITVTLPMLDAATLSGAGRVDIDRIEGAARLKLSGAGNIRVTQVAARSLDLTLQGAGNIVAEGGSTANVTAHLLGTGTVDTRKLSAQAASLHLTGTGNLRIRASGRAEIKASGIGNAHVIGTRNCRIEKNGMGNASCDLGKPAAAMKRSSRVAMGPTQTYRLL